MPRKARIDASGALHHIIARGIERGNIFEDGSDHDNFLERLGTIIIETDNRCYGWALIPNHFHLVLKTGRVLIMPDTIIGGTDVVDTFVSEPLPRLNSFCLKAFLNLL